MQLVRRVLRKSFTPPSATRLSRFCARFVEATANQFASLGMASVFRALKDHRFVAKKKGPRHTKNRNGNSSILVRCDLHKEFAVAVQPNPDPLGRRPIYYHVQVTVILEYSLEFFYQLGDFHRM